MIMDRVELRRKTSDRKCCIFHHDITEDERLAQNIMNEIYSRLRRFGELKILREICSRGITKDCCLVTQNSYILIMVLVTRHLLECMQCEKWQSVIISNFFENTIIPLVSGNIRNTQCQLQRKGLLLKSLVPLNIGENQQIWVTKLVRAVIASFDKNSESDSKNKSLLSRSTDIRTDILYSIHDNMQFHCFIYSSPSEVDVQTVEIIGDFLKENNYSYVCADKFCPGESYLPCLTHFVQNSQKIFVIISSEFQSDPYCSKELKQIILPFCIEYENKIIPIVMGESEVPDVLQAIIPLMEANSNWKQKLLTSLEDVHAVTYLETLTGNKAATPIHTKTEKNGKMRDLICFLLYFIVTICLGIKNSAVFILLKIKAVWRSLRGFRYRSLTEEVIRRYDGDREVSVRGYLQSSTAGDNSIINPLQAWGRTRFSAQGPDLDLSALDIVMLIGVVLAILSEEYLGVAPTGIVAIWLIICGLKFVVFNSINEHIWRIQYGVRMLKKSYSDLKTEAEDVINNIYPGPRPSFPKDASNISRQFQMAFIYVRYNHESESLTWIPVGHSGIGMYRISSTLLTPENDLHFQIDIDDQCRSSMPVFANPAKILKITDLFI